MLNTEQTVSKTLKSHSKHIMYICCPQMVHLFGPPTAILHGQLNDLDVKHCYG